MNAVPQIRRDAADAAAIAADDLIGDWIRRALILVDEFGRAHEGVAWMTEEARTYATGRGLEDPPERRAWGGVMQCAVKRGIVERQGYRLDQYGSPKTTWVWIPDPLNLRVI